MPAIKNQRVNLTDDRARKAKAPASGRRFVYDAKSSGLVLCIMPNESKTFYLYRRVNGQPKRTFLGKVPALNVSSARELATKMTVDILDGKDPMTHRRATRGGLTLGEAWSK